MPLTISVSMPLVVPTSTAWALNVLPSNVQSFCGASVSSMVCPFFSMASLGMKRRAFDGTVSTLFFSSVKMVTLAVRPGFSFRSLLGADMTTS